MNKNVQNLLQKIYRIESFVSFVLEYVKIDQVGFVNSLASFLQPE